MTDSKVATYVLRLKGGLEGARLFTTDSLHQLFREVVNRPRVAKPKLIEVDPYSEPVDAVLDRATSTAGSAYAMCVDAASWAATPKAIDEVCRRLNSRWQAGAVPRPVKFILLVADKSTYDTCVVTQRILIPTLLQEKVGVLVLGAAASGTQVLDARQIRPNIRALPTRGRIRTARNKNLGERPAFDSLIDVIYGHFELPSIGRHSSALIATSKLLANDRAIIYLRGLLIEKLGDEFSLLTRELNDGGLTQLAVALADTEDATVTLPIDLKRLSTKACGILVDCLTDPDVATKVVGEARSRGAERVFVLALTKMKDVAADDAHALVELPRVASTFDPASCDYCRHHVLVTNADIGDFSGALREFDPFSFWRLVAADRRYYTIGHWPSPVTSYHYLFRVLFDPILPLFGFGFGVRLRNALAAAGLFPSWIEVIVAPGDITSAQLAADVARAFRLDARDVITMPRAALAQITGRHINDGFFATVPADLEKRLQGRNVLIVDQAAHHFKTLRALHTACEHFGAKVLAFSVILNRVTTGDFSDALPNAHFVRLYDWPVPPLRSAECRCEVRA
jgi:hypothetical protein